MDPVTLANILAAGAAIKFILSSRVGDKEVIDYLPDTAFGFPIKHVAAHLVGVVAMFGYGSTHGHYSGPDAMLQAVADLSKGLGMGATAINLHGILSDMIPKAKKVIAIAETVDAALPVATAAPLPAPLRQPLSPVAEASSTSAPTPVEPATGKSPDEVG